MTVRPLSAAVVAVIVLAAGCATTGYRPEPPVIRLDGVRLLEAGWSSQRFRLDFEAMNPNAIALPVRSIDYTVRLAGQRFATGSASESFTLPANGEGRFSIEVQTNLMESASMLSTLIFREGRREIDYELGGELGINLPFVKPLQFRESGRVSLALR
jgi:LEA14-like dessication related protein